MYVFVLIWQNMWQSVMFCIAIMTFSRLNLHRDYVLGIHASRNLTSFVRVVVGWVRGCVVMCVCDKFYTIRWIGGVCWCVFPPNFVMYVSFAGTLQIRGDCAYQTIPGALLRLGLASPRHRAIEHSDGPCARC